MVDVIMPPTIGLNWGELDGKAVTDRTYPMNLYLKVS